MEEIEFYNCLPGGVFRCGTEEDWPLDFFNTAFCKMHGCETEDELRDFVGGVWINAIGQEDRTEIRQVLQTLQTQSMAVECHGCRKDGTNFWVHYLLCRKTDRDGKDWIYGMATDMTEKREQILELSRGEECLHILAGIGNHVVFDMNAADRTLRLYGNFAKQFGREPVWKDFHLACKPARTVHVWSGANGANLNMIGNMRLENVQKDLYLTGEDGQEIWCKYQSRLLYDETGKVVRQVGRLINMEEIKEEQAMLREQAQRDPLTGLFNRETARMLIQHALKENDGYCVLVIMDLDNFKHINDTFGHPKGDLVLKHLAAQLGVLFRSRDVIGRLGGDEFMVCLCQVKLGRKVAQRISDLCVHAFDGFDSSQIGGEKVTLSAGVVSTKRPDATFEELYIRADKALYRAKRLGKGIACFESW